MTQRPNVALIIPAFREELRLPHYLPDLTAELAKAPFQTLIQIVDDGSPQDSFETLRDAVSVGQTGNCTVLPLIHLEKNGGKGATILAGWAHAPNVDWLAFVDADGAIPASFVTALLAKIVQGEQNRSVIGVRLDRGVKRNFLRNLAGWTFRQLTAYILQRKAQDTQCGLKAIPYDSFAKIQPLIIEFGFAFDVNLLLALESVGYRVEEFPVAFRDVGGGQIRLAKDSRRMLASVLRLRAEKSKRMGRK